MRPQRIYMTAVLSCYFTLGRQREARRPAGFDHAGVIALYGRRHARRRGNVFLGGSVRIEIAAPEKRDTIRLRVRWREWLMVAPEDRAAIADLDPSGLGEVVFAQSLGEGWQLVVP